MTLDGFCDHTAGIVDDETHQHYNDLLSSAGTLIYGRTTFQMMESYWPTLVENPSGNKVSDEFAVLIDDIPKIVYSRTLKNVEWRNSTLKSELVREEVLELKQQAGKDIVVGSPSMIVAFTKLNLVDEFQLMIHPVILGKGLTLFKNMTEKVDLKLLKTKMFGCGAVVMYYTPVRAGT